MLSDYVGRRVYVAAPYSHPDSAVVDWRMEQVNRVTAALIEAGIIAFSPLTYSHGELDRLTGYKFDWLKFDLEFLALCDLLLVVMLPGWDESVGVKRERKVAYDRGLAYIQASPEIIIACCEEMKEV